MKSNLKLEVKVNTSDVENALKRVKMAMDEVQKASIYINVVNAEKKKWYQFWK